MKRLVIGLNMFVFVITIQAQTPWDTTTSGQITYSSGLVGIGTTSPDSELHIEGGPWSGIKIKNTTTTGGRGTQNYYLDGNNDGWTMFFGGHYSGQPLRFAPVTGGTQGAVSLSLLDNGNVGIGTTAPSEKFEVYQSDRPRIKLTNSATGTGSSDGAFLGLVNNSPDLNIWNLEDGFIRLATNNLERVRVDNSGNVGIGTPTVPSGYKLAVDGKIITEEVNVSISSAWPDYVFSENYQLTTLEELEAFIKSNKHLPEVPSASEVEANGVKLGEMNALLLKKIEELTLYVIDQDKSINTFRADNDQLRIKNEELRIENKAQQKRLEANSLMLETLLQRIEKLETN